VPVCHRPGCLGGIFGGYLAAKRGYRGVHPAAHTRRHRRRVAQPAFGSCRISGRRQRQDCSAGIRDSARGYGCPIRGVSVGVRASESTRSRVTSSRRRAPHPPEFWHPAEAPPYPFRGFASGHDGPVPRAGPCRLLTPLPSTEKIPGTCARKKAPNRTVSARAVADFPPPLPVPRPVSRVPQVRPQPRARGSRTRMTRFSRMVRKDPRRTSQPP
jgi:hypothetical protein